MTYEKVRAVWLECERLGFDSVWLYDHLISVSSLNPSDDNMEGWTLLSALAPQTKTIDVGILVLCNNFRHPPLLAKMASTLDVISGGRLVLGIGAGWNPTEHAQYGMHFPRSAERLSRLDEALHIIRLMWTEDAATFHGKYYSIERAVNSPKPIRRPHPPILVGSLTGGGKMAAIAAAHADIYNTFTTGIKDYERKMEHFRSHLNRKRRDFHSVETTITAWPTLMHSNAEVNREVKLRARKEGLSAKEYQDSKKDQIFGTPDMSTGVIKRYEKLGLDGIIFGYSQLNTNDYLELLAEITRQFR